MKTVKNDPRSAPTAPSNQPPTEIEPAVAKQTPPLITTPVDDNPNTEDYWDERFGTGDWEANEGRSQTEAFARAQIPHYQIAADFEGTILDFGCGLGDGIPVYHRAFQSAQLLGMDISTKAIEQCTEQYGSIAKFFQGDHTATPDVDVIIASNVFEHLSNDREIARQLLQHCNELYIVVPYKERLKPGSEHVNSYDEQSFDEVAPSQTLVFNSPGWTHMGWDLAWNIWAKNLIRPLLGKRLAQRGRQIMYRFTKS